MSVYEIFHISDRGTWEQWHDRARPHTFLQTWQWGEFHRRQGNTILRLGVRPTGGGDVAALALVAVVASRRGRFLFCPHGPIFLQPEAIRCLPELTDFLRERGREIRASFIRFSSILPDNAENRRAFTKLKYRAAPIHMHPELAWMLDVRPPEAAVFAGMRKTMRQLIRKAEQLGVRVEHGTHPMQVEDFLRLYQATARRQHFVAFSDTYLRDELAAFGDEAQIFLASDRGEVLAGAIIIFTPHAAFYHHGASVRSRGKPPAAYLLQWRAILEAQRRGLEWYNFWGIAPPDNPRHPWAGLSAFKQGFGGVSEAYVHAQDLALNFNYWLNYLVERIRRARRRL